MGLIQSYEEKYIEKCVAFSGVRGIFFVEDVYFLIGSPIHVLGFSCIDTNTFMRSVKYMYESEALNGVNVIC